MTTACPELVGWSMPNQLEWSDAHVGGCSCCRCRIETILEKHVFSAILSLEGLLEALVRHEAEMDVREMCPLVATQHKQIKGQESQSKVICRFALVKQAEANAKRTLCNMLCGWG